MNTRFLALLSAPLFLTAASARAGESPYNPPPAKPAPAAPATTTYLVCSTRNRDNTAGWVARPVAVSSTDVPAAESAWQKKAVADYSGFPTSTGCMRFPSTAAAETKRAAILDTMHDDGLKVSEVTWTYAASAQAAQAAPAASGAGAPAAPVTVEAVARAEMKNSQGWCEYNMHELRTLFGCDCFAKAVYAHHVAHPEEFTQDPRHPQGVPPSAPSLLAGIPWTLDVGECLTDPHIDAYATEMLTVKAPGHPNTGKLSVEPRVETCIEQTFTKSMRAQPLANLVQSDWNKAVSTCTGSRP